MHCSGGFTLHGFPRTLAQAKALATLLALENLALDAVLDLALPNDKAIARLGGRRVCPRCAAVFHVEAQQPRIAGVCDHCGTDLLRRPDDHPESVRVRLQAYATDAAPVAAHYRRQGLLVPVDAAGDPVENFAHALDGLAAIGLHA